MALSTERRLEILERLTAHLLSEKKLSLKQNEVRRSVGDIAKAIGVPLDELSFVMRPILKELVMIALVALPSEEEPVIS